MSDENRGKKLPSGRITRLARMASMTARTATGLAVGHAARAVGREAADTERQAAQRVLETLGTLKGAAMKLGQQLAMEADSLPPEARELVARLFAQAPAMSFERIAEVVQEEFDEPVDAVFARFDREPIAAASLGQVHRARLADGTEVAVKIQYPGVAEALINDLKNAELLVRTFGRAAKTISEVDARPYYEELRREIGAEVDYLRESRLCAEYTNAVRRHAELVVPRVYPLYTTRRVLTMEFLDGVPLNAFAESNAGPEERWRVARQLALAVLSPFAGFHLIHADPHPGNFLVTPDARLAVLDFGAVKHLTPEFASNFWTLLTAELRGSEPDFVQLLERARFRIRGDRAVAQQTLSAIHAIAARPVLAEFYDWGASTIVPDMRRFFAGHFRDMVNIQAPPESVMFYRAVGGLANNLRALRAAGNCRSLCGEIAGVEPTAPRAL